MAYATYPMPDDYPDYPNHLQIARYFDDYVDHFGLRERIRFRTEVTQRRAGRRRVGGDGRGRATARRRRNRYRRRARRQRPPLGPALARAAVPRRRASSRASRCTPTTTASPTCCAASGCWCWASATRPATSRSSPRGSPRRPSWRCAAAPTSCPSTCSASRPTKPASKLLTLTAARRCSASCSARMLGLTAGDMTAYGLPKPDHKLLEAHPTVSAELLSRLGHGDIAVKPNIDRFGGGRTVRFVDGSEEEIDLVVYCTGYKITFPFFDDEPDLGRRQPPAALPPGRLARAPGPLLHRPDPAARRDHAARRGAGGVGRRPARAARGTLPSPAEMRAEIVERAKEDGEALRRLEASHDPGGLPALSARDPARAEAGGSAGLTGEEARAPPLRVFAGGTR